jgi:hypothetical protein
VSGVPGGLPARPTIYELNTAVWLERLGRDRGRRLSLDEVPGAEWDALAALPVDAVWLMGVWRRSPAGRAIAESDPALDAANRAALPDLRAGDVIGSPYCVRDYVVDERFGGPVALGAARAALAARGLGLILDYVPNHVAPDHPWTTARPECLLRGGDEDARAHPEAFLRTAAGVFAKGRDPYFPAWPDVVQLNAFAPALREAATETVAAIARQCDGVRCDMAMLVTNEVFARTWGERAGRAPADEYWPGLIAAVKATHEDFRFIAEAYWDMEWTLQQQGFDFCYDKRLYDRLAHETAESVFAHLQAGAAYQEGLVRFIENHDEPRAAATFEPARGRAAAVAMSTLQGARLYHDGQLEGRRTRIPVFLGRGPDEPADADLRAFYGRLLRAVAESGLRTGDWRLCAAEGEAGTDAGRQVLAWCWTTAGARHVVAVNLSGAPAAARVRIPWADVRGRTWVLDDRLDGRRFERDGDEVAAEGLDVALDPWGAHFLAWAPVG